MIFRQLFEPQSSTYTYVLGCARTQRGVLIDPVVETVGRDLAVLAELGLTLRYVLETHLHADHVTGAWRVRQATGARVVINAAAGALQPDLAISDGVVLEVGDLAIECRHTPGHTNGCTSYYVGDRVFTGDALLIGGCGRTDFQGGDAGGLYDSVHAKIFSLPPDTLVLPAHDYKGQTVSTVRQELTSNPRLGGGRSRQEFIDLMAALRLAYPKQIDRALPANRTCGREVPA